MSPLQNQNEYWLLVEQLMQHGWYRAGAGPRADGDRIAWGFRQGHLLDVGNRITLWITAGDEDTAMRVLLTELRAHEANLPQPIAR